MAEDENDEQRPARYVWPRQRWPAVAALTLAAALALVAITSGVPVMRYVSAAVIALAGYLGVAYVRGSRSAIIRSREERALRHRSLRAQRIEHRRDASDEEFRQAYRDLQDARARLLQSETMASLGRLTAGLAHEINTPMTAVVGNVKPLWNEIARLRDRAGLHGDDVLEASIARLRAIVEVMARGAERTADIVHDLRVFSRVGETTPQPMDLHEGIDVTLRLLRPRWAERVEVHKDYGAVPHIEASRSQMNQVLVNLLVNAFDAIQGPGNIWIGTRVETGQVVVTVRDDGCGIAAEHLGRVFDPFFTTKPVGKGTGLGLAICGSIVRNHGGTLSVASDAGKGSTFTLILPLRRPADTTDSRPPTKAN